MEPLIGFNLFNSIQLLQTRKLHNGTILIRNTQTDSVIIRNKILIAHISIFLDTAYIIGFIDYT